MRGVQVRGAGGLLIGVCVQPLLQVFEYGPYGDGLFDAVRTLFWAPPGGSPPGDMVPFLIVRGLLVFGGLVLGVLAVAGLRAVRYPVVVVSTLLALGILPWAIWSFDPRTIGDPPPEWVMEHPLWWMSTRGMSVLLLAMLVATIVLAMLDRGAQPAVAGAGLPPGYARAPYGPFGGATPAATGPWMSAGVMGPPRPNPPGPASAAGPTAVPVPAPPQDAPPSDGPVPEPVAPPPPTPPGEPGSRRPPTPF